MCKGYTPEYGQDMCHIMAHNLPYFKCALCPSIYSFHHSHNMDKICVTLWPTIDPISSARCALQSTVATTVISRQQFGRIVSLCIHDRQYTCIVVQVGQRTEENKCCCPEF